MSTWQQQLQHSLTSSDQLMNFARIHKPSLLKQSPPVERSTLEKRITTVIQTFPMRITPYYLSLMQSAGDPIWKQAVPDPLELQDDVNIPDPLCEGPQSPVPSIIHRYPDRVIFLVSNRCAVYCRHCMRKRKVGILSKVLKNKSTSFKNEQEITDPFSPSPSMERGVGGELSEKIESADEMEQGLAYIAGNKKIFDVILSGGDPLLLDTDTLDRILYRVKAMDHVQTIRIHTRTLCTLPARITDNLVSVLKRYHPLYINTHFNHPMEITDAAATACAALSDAGIPLGCQTVLLKGVNDTPEVMIDLMRALLRIRVKPYYLHHPDAVAGTAHFRLPLERGIEIIKAMRGHISGMAIPHYVIDLPGGHGKTPIIPDYLKSLENGRAIVENYQGKRCEYLF